MVRVIPGYEPEAGRQHRLGLLAVAPAVLRVLGEDRDVLEQPARGQPIHSDLPVEATRHESVELIVLAGAYVHLFGGVAGVTHPAGAGATAAGKAQDNQHDRKGGTADRTHLLSL